MQGCIFFLHFNLLLFRFFLILSVLILILVQVLVILVCAFAFFDIVVIISEYLKCNFDFRAIIFVIDLFEFIYSSKVYIFVLIKMITINLVYILYKCK